MKNEEIVYIELNDWFEGRDYPACEPFKSWFRTKPTSEVKYPLPKFRDEKWLIENQLVCVEGSIDMSLNYCITAPKSWVESTIPMILTEYKQFLRYPDEDQNPPFGRFDCPFLPYTKENIGLHRWDEDEGWLYEE